LAAGASRHPRPSNCRATARHGSHPRSDGGEGERLLLIGRTDGGRVPCPRNRGKTIDTDLLNAANKQGLPTAE
jgi:hypothetical protein